MDLPQLSVVICAHTQTFLPGALQALAQSVGVTWETWVITSQNPLTLTQVPGIHYLWHTGSPAEKRDFAVGFTRAPFLVFLDDDVEVRPDTLYQLHRFLQETPACSMAFCRIYNAERPTELDDAGSWLSPTGFLYARAGDPRADRRDIEQVDRPCLASKSATCIIRRRAYTRAGGFDAEYGILGEETALAWKVWLTGGQVWYTPRAVSAHWFNTTRKRTSEHYTPERIFRHGARNYVMLLCTMLGLGRLWWMLPLHVGAWLVAALGMLLRGKLLPAWLILRGLTEAAQWGPRIAQRRRWIQRKRVITDRALFSHIAWSPPVGYYLRRMRQYVVTGLHG